MPIIAAIQINGSSDIERNLSTTERLVRKAAQAGAKFVATPEATTYLGPHDRKIKLAEPVDWLAACKTLGKPWESINNKTHSEHVCTYEAHRAALDRCRVEPFTA